MTDRLLVDLPLPLDGGPNKREHHMVRARRVKKERQLAAWVFGSRIRGWAPCVVTITRFSKQKCDRDNLIGRCKAVRDGIADALGVDDASDRVQWEYDERIVTKTNGLRLGVRIEVQRTTP